MTWVHQSDKATAHTCHPPIRSMHGLLPPITSGATRAPYSWTAPAGGLGDLWRCECRTLWRVADACDICDAYGDSPHPGQHAVGYKWRPATLWQRLRTWRNR